MAEFQVLDLSHHNSVTDFLAVKNARDLWGDPPGRVRPGNLPKGPEI